MSERWRRLTIATGIAVTLYVLLVGLVWWYQDSLVFSPTHRYVDLPENHGLRHEDVKLEITSGVTVHGWFIPAAGKPRATVLYLHGNGGNLSVYLPNIRLLTKAGFDTLSIDYEGYGESEGLPSEANTYRDASAAWLWLTDKREIEPKHIVIWGFSLGGGIATHLAETHTPGALVLQSTFTSVPDLGARLFYWLPARLLSHNFFNNLDRVPKIHAPIFIAHGRSDKLIPFEMGQHLFAVANGPKAFSELTGGHNNGLLATSTIWKDLMTFLTQAGVVSE